MKITLAILLIACLHVAANGYSQAITLSVKNAPLEKVFEELKKQTGLNFFYSSDVDLQKANPVTLNVNNTPVNEVLDFCFKNQPFTYSILDKVVVIKQKLTKSFSLDNIVLTTIDIKGKVTNENGDPIAGVTVTVKGTHQATSTNSLGEFSISNTDKNAILIFTGINVETFEVKVTGQEELMVRLTTKVNKLDEVQVIAYGTTTRRLSTGNITTVKAADIEKQPVNNPLLALEGKVPGMQITQATGLPGSGVKVQIRGRNSILNGTDPLYIIDGVPFSSQLLPSLNGILGANGATGNNSGSVSGNPLSYINPTDIESIDVLKDADATAIYGSRAANGAVLITTKKGKTGSTRVEVNAQSGWGKVTRFLNLMNTKEYLQMRHEALNNDGLAPDPNSDYDLTLWDTTRNTDWQKTLIGGTARYNDIHASISGGNSNTQYLLGGGYHRETTVFPGSFSDQKSSMHFSITNTSLDQKFHLQLTGSYVVDNNNLLQTDLTGIAVTLPPDAPRLYNTDGTLNWADNGGVSTWPNLANPMRYIFQQFNTTTNSLISNAIIGYQLLPNLEIKTSLGYTNMQMDQITMSPFAAIDPLSWPISTRSATFGNNNIHSWIIEPQVTYKKSIGRGRFDLLVGSTINQRNSYRQSFSANGFNNDLSLADIKSASSIIVGSTINSIYKYNALFSRLSFNWDDKYLINFNARRDGSSRFGPESQFHNFAGVGIGWVFSKEDFIQENIPQISFGKLRASYGTTGNDQIGDYTFLELYNSFNVGRPYQSTNGIIISRLYNPNLQWEETRKIEGGLELGFFKDRFIINASYYLNRSSNELLSYKLPSITGFTSIISNFPATVQNRGWEFLLNTINFKSKNFSWKSSFNLTIPYNKLISFPNLSSSSYSNSLIIGQPITILKQYHFLNVNDTSGIYQFANSQGISDYNPDTLSAIINTAPKYYGGFQNSFRYKRIELDILFQYVKQIGQNYQFGNYPGSSQGNQPTTVLGRWQKKGDITNIQRFNSDYSLASQYSYVTSSDAMYSDASFIRLKNIALSWQFSENWCKKMHLHNFRLYLQGQNLLTITNFIGMDPENQSTSSLPPLRVLTFGIQVTL